MPEVLITGRSAAISFDGSGSSDPDDDTLTYRWDFGDGATGSGGFNPAHAYAAGDDSGYTDCKR